MIDFVSEEVRTQFHLLPLSEQKLWMDFAEKIRPNGFVIKMYYIEEVSPGVLEASVRIAKEFNTMLSPENDQLNLPGIQ